jgi:hypothetical protein
MADLRKGDWEFAAMLPCPDGGRQRPKDGSVAEYNAAIKIKLRVEHRLGEVLAETVSTNRCDSESHLADGIEPKQSSRAQQLAAVPWGELEARIDAETEKNEKAKPTRIVKELRQEQQRDENRRPAQRKAPGRATGGRNGFCRALVGRWRVRVRVGPKDGSASRPRQDGRPLGQEKANLLGAEGFIASAASEGVHVVQADGNTDASAPNARGVEAASGTGGDLERGGGVHGWVSHSPRARRVRRPSTCLQRPWRKKPRHSQEWRPSGSTSTS